MAHHSNAHAGEHPDMDYAEHEATYAKFVGFVKYGTIVVGLIVVGMYVFLV